MYKRILIPLDNSISDQKILEHIRPLAKLMQSHIILLHVADGYVARFQEQLNLQDSEEIKKDRIYLESRKNELIKDGFSVTAHLVGGEPAKLILEIVQKETCDLIAMATHGHRFVKDVILGSVADTIRHQTDIPILMIRASQA